MEFSKLEVGCLLKEGVTHYKEGIKFDITDSGALVRVAFPYPTEKEIEQFESDKDFKVGYYKEKNVIVMLFKFGDLNWMDAPYSVHLSRNLTKLDDVTTNEGLALTIVFVDASTGIVKNLRLIGLPNGLTKELFADIKKQKELSFDGFDENLGNIYRKYSTKQLVNVSRNVRAKIIKKDDKKDE